MTTVPAIGAPRLATSRSERLVACGRSLFSPQRLVYVAVLAILLWQVAVPVFLLLYTSLHEARPTDADFLSPSLTLDNIRSAVEGGRLLSVTATTAVFALSSMALALVLGSFLAWITTRTDAPFGKLIGLLTIVKLAVPGILLPVAWIFLAGPDVGLVNTWWRSLTGSEHPLFSIYGMGGMIIVNGFAMMPMVYLFTATVFSSMNHSLEEAAQVAGASVPRSLRDISLRLAAPGIAAVAVMAIMRAWEAFEVPWLLGLRTKTFTYASEIYLRTSTPPSDVGLVSTYAVFMLAGAVLLIWWYDRFNRKGERYAVITGKSYSPTKVHLGRWRWPATVASFAILAVALIIPLLMLTWMSLQRYYEPPSWSALGDLGFGAYSMALATPNVVQGFVNSLVIGLASSAILLVLATLSAWFSARRKAGGRLLYLLTFAPMALPNVIVGISFLWLFLLLPLPVYGTHWAVILAYVTLNIAIVGRLVGARMLQIHPELEEAAQVSGASFTRSLWTILVPMLVPALLASSLFTMVLAFRELQSTLYLAGPDTRTAAVVMFDLAGEGAFSTVAALGIITFGILLIGMLGYQRLAARMGVEGF